MNKLRVFSVDDDGLILDLHRYVLGHSNIKLPIEEFSDGDLAFNAVINSDIDNDDFLIFLDINMPNMNAWQFLDLLQEKVPTANIFVVIVTSSTSVADVNKALGYERVFEYVEKPLKSNQVNEVIEHKLVSHYFQDSLVD
jgi:response regulator RpfG family c-di-GMP phosphodiesterase